MKEKPILIQVAMEIECEELVKKLANKEEVKINNYQFYKGTINNYPFVVSLSKIGLIHTSSSLTIVIREFNPIIIINYGIAGATSKELHIKDIVIGERCLNINSYRTPNLKKGEGSNPIKWELVTFLSGETDTLIYEYANQKLLQLSKKIKYNAGKIYYGIIGSGDVWDNEYDRILYLNKNYHILCEDMESIATYTIAKGQNIPVISIKMISNNYLTEEEYNREVSIYLQDFILDYLDCCIKKLLISSD